MSVENVPRIDGRYWVIMSLASVLGCNTGDDCSFYVHWNHWIGLAPLAFIFFGLLYEARRTRLSGEGWYWSLVIVLRTAATNLADLATHTFSIPYIRFLLCLAVLQCLIVWRMAPRQDVGMHDRAQRPATSTGYWLSLLTAGTLGTAAGDWIAEELHLSTGYATVLVGFLAVIVVLFGGRSLWKTKAMYWAAVVAIRTAGTTAGDWLAFREEPGLHNGLQLGLPLSTALSATVFLAALLFSRRSMPGRLFAS